MNLRKLLIGVLLSGAVCFGGMLSIESVHFHSQNIGGSKGGVQNIIAGGRGGVNGILIGGSKGGVQNLVAGSKAGGTNGKNKLIAGSKGGGNN